MKRLHVLSFGIPDNRGLKSIHNDNKDYTDQGNDILGVTGILNNYIKTKDCQQQLKKSKGIFH